MKKQSEPKPKKTITIHRRGRVKKVTLRIYRPKSREPKKLIPRKPKKVKVKKARKTKVPRLPQSHSGRVSPEFQYVQQYGHHLQLINGTVVSNVPVPHNHRAFYRQWDSTNTPGFRSIRKRDLPFRPYSLRVIDEKPGFVVSSNNVIDSITGWSYFDEYRTPAKLLDLTGVPTQHLSEAERICSSRAHDKLKTLKVNLATFFAERYQTIDMIASTVGRLIHGINALRKGRLEDAYRALSVPVQINKLKHWMQKFDSAKSPAKVESLVANTWLELQYGWKPLLSDVHDAANLLAQHVADKNPQYVVVTGKETDTYDRYFASRITGLPYLVGQDFVESTCRYFIHAIPSAETSSALAATGITNPALLVWEEIPFSFVVDWFLPVGNYLEQLHTYDGFETIQIHRARFTKWSSRLSASYGSFDGTEYGNRVIKRDTVNQFGSGYYYDRDNIPLGTFPPEFKSPVSIVHAANALALLSQVFRR